ncbi:MAG TPA: hypothetical protein VLK22_04385 [Candidatus Udaeobacter sp.]|nr:hypothetical protein [Candidatus Udaeobacter sp.]
MPDRETSKEIIFAEELKHLIADKPRIYKMTKEGEDDFYFDNTDLLNHKDNFFDMRSGGWEVSKDVFEELPNYLPARRQSIADAGFDSFDWGYKKAENP